MTGEPFEMTTHPMTQKQRVLAFLRMYPEGICVSMLPTEISYTARNRVCELRHDGFTIDSSPCRTHKHKSSVAMYRLVTAPVQQTLVMA